MRPLPTLDPLAPAQDVYDPATDSFSALLGGDLANYDSLQKSLESSTNSAVQSAGDIQSTLDSIGSIFDGLDQTFTHLDNSLAQLDYRQKISDVAALDKAFANNLTGWVPNVAGASLGFIADIGKAIDQVFKDFVAATSRIAGYAITDLVTALEFLFNTIINAIVQLANLIAWVIQQLLALASTINVGVSMPGVGIGIGSSGGGFS